MPSFLVDQLEHFGQRVRATDLHGPHEWAGLADEVAEMSALAVHLLGRIDTLVLRRQAGTNSDDASAAVREFLPLYRAWSEYAVHVRALRHACKEHGYPVEGAEAFLRGCNHARMMVDYDQIAESIRRIDRGESRGRPLDEVMDELLHLP